MQNIFRIVILASMLLSACSSIPAAPGTPLPATTEAPLPISTTSIPDPKPVSTIATPHIDQPPNPDVGLTSVTSAPSDPGACGYQWAYQDLPELSASFQQSIQALQPEAQANAFAFGENCVGADGSIVSFSAMETDFNVTLQVSDLTNQSDLGEWVVKVMDVITAIPPEQIVGPRPGRVSLIFQSGSEQQGINFYINQYQELPSGLSSAELYQSLQTSQ